MQFRRKPLRKYSQIIELMWKKSWRLGWGPSEEIVSEWPRTNIMGAGGHPEHFKPKQRSVTANATQRTA